MTAVPGARRTSWLDEATATLTEAGVPSPRVDAELLAVALGRRQPLDTSADPGPQYWGLVRRRAAREPLQHLLGRAWFRHLEVAVGPGVFVPRPETEVVAQAAIDEAQRRSRCGRRPVVVDLGTGSGVIALSIAGEVPGSVVHAVEVDEQAWAWAARNCAGHPVVLHRADLRECCPELDASVDVVVSNPPYIPPDAVPVDPEVSEYDPPRALYGGGDDGLDVARAVVARARRLLREGGLLVLEHADSQSDDVAGLLAAPSWAQVTAHRDLARRPRFVTARRTGAS
jgi:release factor glutamine methyltransferase